MSVKSVATREDGQGLVEYGLIIALVSIAVIGALVVMGDRLNTLFSSIGQTV